MRHSSGGVESVARLRSGGDQESFTQNCVPELRFQGGRRHELHSAAEQVPQLSLKSDKFGETDRPSKLDHKVDVAVFVSLIAGGRPEQRQANDAKPIQNGTASAECGQKILAPSRFSFYHDKDSRFGYLGGMANLGSTTYGDVFVDTAWTTGVHDYAETRGKSLSSASDLLPRIVMLTF